MENIVLETDRIKFIKPSKNLVEDYKLMYNNSYMQLFLFKKSYNKEQIEKWINSFFDDDKFMSLIEKETNKFIGNVSLIKKDNNVGEISISITPSMQGKRFATEALESLIKYGHEKLNFKSVDLFVYRNNEKAIHLYENLGFEIDEQVKDGGSIHMIHNG